MGKLVGSATVNGTNNLPTTTESNSSTSTISFGTIGTELLLAFERALFAAVGAFAGTVSTNTLTDGAAAKTAGISAAVVAIISFGTSIRSILGGQN